MSYADEILSDTTFSQVFYVFDLHSPIPTESLSSQRAPSLM